MEVEIIYAGHQKIYHYVLDVHSPCSVKDVFFQSNMKHHFLENDFETLKFGIFSKRVTADTPVKVGDRIEIYRCLEIDPKTARRKRAERKS